MSFKSYIMKNKKKLRRRRALIVFLSVLAILGMSTATFAWFTVNTFAGIDKFELKISTGEDLRVSMSNHGSDIEQYVKIITNPMIDGYLRNDGKKLDDIVLDPVTTNNGSSFTFQNGTSATKNENYLEFECYFIATREMWVHLSTEAFETNGQKVKGTEVTTSSPAPQSDVVRAMRMDFQTASDFAAYEPNKGNPVTRLSTFDLPSGTMNYNNSNRLFHLEKLTPTKTTIRLWIEGEDPECDNDIQGADLQIQLAFVGCDENGTPIA